jgi:hypothetical protein
MPNSESGKAIASRNATTHGLFARDVVLPTLGEDPDGYRQLEAEWIAQIAPRNLLERHYVEKIAAASWRLRRLHRWQAQLLEDDGLTEDERLDRLDKVLRHETALHRQIDTAVKMLGKDVPQLYLRRVRDQVLEEAHISERECREDAQDDASVEKETRSRLFRLRRATEQATEALSQSPLDTAPPECTIEICQNEPNVNEPQAADAAPPQALTPPQAADKLAGEEQDTRDTLGEARKKCQKELPTPAFEGFASPYVIPPRIVPPWATYAAQNPEPAGRRLP